MAEYTVDKLQIEIESSSSKSVAKINELMAALKKLKSTTSGFSNPANIKVNSSGVDSAAKKVSGLKKTLDGVRSATSPIKSLVSNSLVKPFQNAANTVSKFKSAIGRIAFYRLIRSTIKAVADGFKEGMDNLYQYSRAVGTNFAPAMDSLATSALYLKNSLGALAAPLVEVLAPAIDFLVDKFVDLTNAIGMALAALTGKTFSKAIKYPKEYAEAVNGATKAQKKFLLGIDELNIFDPGSAGGGAAALDYTSMFEEVDTKQFDNLGEAFNAFVDGISEKLPQLDIALSGAADKINGFFSKIREALNYKTIETTVDIDVNGNYVYKLQEVSIRDKVKQLGVDLANSLNGFVNQINWNDIGGALGAGLDTALGFLVGFIYTFDWKNLGDKLAQAFNGFIAEMDWYQFGQFIWGKFKIAIETLTGFLLGVDMTELAQAASNIVKGFFDSMTNTIENTDWYALGQQVKTFLVNIDWAGIATSVFTTIGAAVGGLASFVMGIIDDWLTDFAGFLHNAIEDANGDWADAAFNIVGGILSGLITAVADIAGWLMENVVTPFIDGLTRGFGINNGEAETTKGVGKSIVEGFLSGLKSAWTSVTSWASSAIQGIKDFFSGTKFETSVNTSGTSGYANIKLQQRASGGFVDRGTAFLAGEDGPEIITNIGNRTGVINEQQLTGGVEEGVERGMEPLLTIVAAGFSQVVQAIAEYSNDGGVTLSDRDIYRAWQRGSQGIGGALVKGAV